MICKECRKERHEDCFELERQQTFIPLAYELLGGQWCECLHLPPMPLSRQFAVGW